MVEKETKVTKRKVMVVLAVPQKRIAENADGLAMPYIEHWASDNRAMEGSDQTDVTAPKGKFVFVLKWAAVELNY